MQGWERKENERKIFQAAYPGKKVGKLEISNLSPLENGGIGQK